MSQLAAMWCINQRGAGQQGSFSNVRSFTLRITLSPARCKFRRRLIIKRGVRATFVIILTPFTDGFPGMADVAKPVFIQAFIAKASVKTLNKSVLLWLTRQNKMQLHAMLKGPFIERAVGKFRAGIGYYCGRIALKQRDAVQNESDLNA